MLTILIAGAASATTFAGGVPTLSSLAELSTCVSAGVVRSAEAAEAPWGTITNYEIEVEEVYAGDCPPQLLVYLPGGKVGGLVQTYSGVPVWEVGDEVLVFLPDRGRMPMTGVFTIRDHVIIDPLARWGDRLLLDDELPSLLAHVDPTR